MLIFAALLYPCITVTMEKIYRYTIVLCLFAYVLATDCCFAQVAVADTSIVQYLERNTTGGSVHITQPKELERRLVRSEGLQERRQSAMITVYRIQLFSDNRSRTAKSEAERKASVVKNTFPRLDVYVTYTSPFWRLRVGNYRSYEEANKMMYELKKAFPEMAGEMRIVRDKANVQVLDYIND